MRSFGTVARDRHVNEPRIYFPQFFVAEAVLFRRTGPEVLSEDVRLRDQLAKDLAALCGFQVQREALHATIVGLEIGAGHTGQDGRAARIVADLRHLDLDHLRAEIGHQHVRHRAGLRGGAGDDLHALQGTMWLSHVEQPPSGSAWPAPNRAGLAAER